MSKNYYFKIASLCSAVYLSCFPQDFNFFHHLVVSLWLSSFVSLAVFSFIYPKPSSPPGGMPAEKIKSLWTSPECFVPLCFALPANIKIVEIFHENRVVKVSHENSPWCFLCMVKESFIHFLFITQQSVTYPNCTYALCTNPVISICDSSSLTAWIIVYCVAEIVGKCYLVLLENARQLVNWWEEGEKESISSLFFLVWFGLNDFPLPRFFSF